MKKFIFISMFGLLCSFCQGNELATLYPGWYQRAQESYDYAKGIESLFNNPLPQEALKEIKLKYNNHPVYVAPIKNLSKHLQTPDGKKKEMQEALAMRLALKEQLNAVPIDLMLYLLFIYIVS